MSQRTLQRTDEGRRKPFPPCVQHAQIGKQVNLGTRLFAAGSMVYHRFALEQRADIDKDIEGQSFAFPYFIALYPTILAPFGEQSRALLRVHIKAEHKLAELFQAL